MPSSNTFLGGDVAIANRFIFEVDGVEMGIFSEVTGLEVTVSTHEIHEGGQNSFVHKVPGRMTWPNLVFRRGVTQSDNLFEWLQKSSGEGFAGAGNKLTRVTGAVTAVDPTGTRLRAWEFSDVYPVRWKGPEFRVDNNVALEEELEVAHHGFRTKTLGGAT
jgi:phage tail-like protein